MKTRRKQRRKLSEQERQLFVRITPPPPGERALLYHGKLGSNPHDPLKAAKYLAEEFRVSPIYGAESLMRIVLGYWNVKGFVPRMLKLLSKYLADDQPMFGKEDYEIDSIVKQHRRYTIKEITSELSKQHPNTKWDTLEKRVRRFLENLPR